MAENLSYICPITQALMVDPVMDREGNSYERSAIEAWIAARGISPITRSPLSLSDLVVNRSLRSAIEDYKASLEEGHPHSGGAAAAGGAGGGVSSTVFNSSSGLNTPLPLLGLEVTSIEEDGEHYVMTSITSPGEVDRIPSDIVCIIDVSGSMGGQATTQGVGAEAPNLSLLDLVKHAVKTIINTLGDADRLAIVSFSDSATVVCQLTLMTASGRARATELLENLTEGGMTNLWDGLLNGLNILKVREAAPCAGIPCDARNACCMLLTDGQPSIEPPRGHLPMLKRYRDSNGGKYPGTINTFGFGYSLDSKLLADVAIEGGGMYSFIPDAGFVGTAFVHALANTLATVARDVTLKLEPEDGTGGRELLGYLTDEFVVSWGYEIPLGTVQAGQTISNIVKMAPGSARADWLLNTQIAYRPSNTSVSLTASGGGPIAQSAMSTAQQHQVSANKFRLRFISTVSRAYATSIDTPQQAVQAVAAVEALCISMRDWLAATADCPSRKHVVGLLADLDGQVKEAVGKPDQFRRWGKHYLPSLVRAHQLQQCNNFKDPGLQLYGGDLFQRIRDTADDIFSDLPPPSAPARQRYSQSYASSSGAGGYAGSTAPTPQTTQQFSMRSFNSRSNPCVHQDSRVAMADGTTKDAKSVKRGDVLAGGTCVECVVQTLCPSGRAEMSIVGGEGLRITPWHPIKVQGRWVFPQDAAAPKDIACDKVFSFLVRECASAKFASEMTIDSVAVVTLAHGIRGDTVVSHPFFGTDEVVMALRACKGWEKGYITFLPDCLKRDPGTNLCNGFKVNAEVV